MGGIVMAASDFRRMGIGRGFAGGLAVAAIVAACGSASVTAGPSASSAGATALPSVGTKTGVSVDWFVGTGAGVQPEQVDAEKAFVAAYNRQPGNPVLKLEIVPNNDAIDTLKTEIAAGDGPDIIGPIGIEAIGRLPGLFLDLSAEIKSQKLDTSAYQPAALKYLQTGTAQFGLPYDVYPGFIFYNKDLLTKANLPALPTKIGQTYMGQAWDWGELGRVAAQLTLDKNGRNSTEAGFDKQDIVQYGFSFQWADARRLASTFGGGSFVAPDGITAQIPSSWTDAFSWYYNALWKSHSLAPQAGASACFDVCPSPGDPSGGHVAMAASWPWAISSYIPANIKGGPGRFSGWDMAVMPTWSGQTNAPMDVESFQIAKQSKVPDQAFKTMLAIMADPALMSALGGGLPARTADQKAWFDSMDKSQAVAFPGNKVTWSVLQEMAEHPALPSHESALPNQTKSLADIDAFLTTLQNKSGLDVAAELAKLKTTLQADFDAVKPLA
jgi:multiple sugar transport system substrate-binding protein